MIQKMAVMIHVISPTLVKMVASADIQNMVQNVSAEELTGGDTVKLIILACLIHVDTTERAICLEMMQDVSVLMTGVEDTVKWKEQ